MDLLGNGQSTKPVSLGHYPVRGPTQGDAQTHKLLPGILYPHSPRDVPSPAGPRVEGRVPRTGFVFMRKVGTDRRAVDRKRGSATVLKGGHGLH